MSQGWRAAALVWESGSTCSLTRGGLQTTTIRTAQITVVVAGLTQQAAHEANDATQDPAQPPAGFLGSGGGARWLGVVLSHGWLSTWL